VKTKWDPEVAVIGDDASCLTACQPIRADPIAPTCKLPRADVTDVERSD
jgi:hypothetical protein